jgi:hypothetical protein
LTTINSSLAQRTACFACPVRQALFNASHSRIFCSCALHRQLIGARLETTIGAPKAGSANAPIYAVHTRQLRHKAADAKTRL